MIKSSILAAFRKIDPKIIVSESDCNRKRAGCMAFASDGKPGPQPVYHVANRSLVNDFSPAAEVDGRCPRRLNLIVIYPTAQRLQPCGSSEVEVLIFHQR